MALDEATLDLLRTLTTHHRIGLVTDFDGTLSPIVPHPDNAAITPAAKESLQQLSHLMALVAVVSGRAVDDVRTRTDLPRLVYSGNHGMERWVSNGIQVAPAVEPYLPNIARIRDEIAQHLLHGMWIEDKKVTLSVHYRQADNPQTTREDMLPLLRQLTEAHNVELFEGRMIFEVRPPVDLDKGTIFRQLVSEYALDAALFIGDDVTDAHALRVARQLRHSGDCYALAVGVMAADEDETPSAVLESSDVLVSGVSGVESLLAWLGSVLSASAT